MNDERSAPLDEEQIEDLDVPVEQAAAVTGGDAKAKPKGGGKQDYLVVKMNDVIITSTNP